MLVLLLEWFALYFVSVPRRDELMALLFWSHFLLTFLEKFSSSYVWYLVCVCIISIFLGFVIFKCVFFFRLVEWFCCRISWHRIRHLSYFVLMIIIFSIYIEYHKRLNSSKRNTSHFSLLSFIFDSTFYSNCRTKNYKCVCMCECTFQLLLDVF